MISDYAARNTALSPERSFIVQAPAGSGKTGLLVYRLLALLARVERPEQILAITFTRKATSEMRERLLQLLKNAHDGIEGRDEFEQQGIELAQAALAQDKKQGWRLLDAPHQLQIQTIDAFCGKLTGHMPWLSRLGDRPRTTDKADLHYAAAIEQLFNELMAAPSELSEHLKTVLLELDFDYGRARKLLSAMLARRDQWLRHLLHNDLAKMRLELEQAWTHVCTEHFSLLESLISKSLLNSLLETGFKAAEYSHADGKASPILRLKEYSSGEPLQHSHWLGLRHLLLTDKGEIRKSRGVNKNIGFPPSDEPHKKKFQEMLVAFEGDNDFLRALDQVKYLPPSKFSDSDWQQIVSLESVLKSLAAFLQLRFRSTGECDHSEVTQRANLALEELAQPTDLALRMDYQINHILVDEFQDTSHGQLQLLRKLTKGWSVEDKHRTLFLVGDPMQSIYRFREADVSLFLQASNNESTRLFSNIHIEALRLSENFRSSPQLVGQFNRIFQSSFPKQDDVLSGAISYAPASHRDTVNDPLEQAQDNSEQPAIVCQLAHNKLHEAQLLVAAIKNALEEMPDDAKVAVLVRGRSHLTALLPALQQAEIAYSGVDIQPLSEAQAIIDALALCKAICQLDDRVAWLSLLRGPWLGLSLAQIKRVLGDEQLPVWHQLISADDSEFDADTRARLVRFCKIMREALMQRQQIPLHNLVRWAWHALGGEQTLFGTALEDIYELFDLIEVGEYGGDVTSSTELDAAIKALFARPKSNSARVVISTMHKAKGLQYHTVILPSLSKKPPNQDKDIFMWAERANDKQSQLLIAPISFTDKPSSKQAASHYDYLRELEAQRSSNETIRLMYVACTRAEKRLVLTACAELDDKTDSETAKDPIKSSLLATVWPTLKDVFEFEGSSSAHLTEKRSDLPIEIPQTLFRLPGDFKVEYPTSVSWQPEHQLQAKIMTQDELDKQQLEFEWATEVATAVGVVLHDWLQFNQHLIFEFEVDDSILKRWRQQLRFKGVPEQRLGFAARRLRDGVLAMQKDDKARFLFADYADQKNEYAIASFERGAVNRYRIDRTFVDSANVRWIIDYKTTYTQSENVDAFIDTQIAERHKNQLQKYGDLMSQIDERLIKLAVYFPMLSQLRSWDYEKS